MLLKDKQSVVFAAYSPHEEDLASYKLHELYLQPQTQGKVLINEVIRFTEEAGRHVLELNVNWHNKAKQFYEKMGFSVAYEKDVLISQYWISDYVMRKDV